jgi:DNA transformation protein
LYHVRCPVGKRLALLLPNRELPVKLNEAQAAALDQLSHVLPVTPKAMFGGIGIYADGLFFALMDGERLYFKVDEVNRPDFEARGLGPFLPYGDPAKPMQYYPVPDEVLADPEELRGWAEAALDVARRARERRGKKRR